MGSGDWFNIIIRKKKTKQDRSRKAKDPVVQQSNASRQDRNSPKYLSKLLNGGCSKKHMFSDLPTEDVAATRIQSAFRAFKVRKTLHALRGRNRLVALMQNHSTKKQVSTTMSTMQLWNRIQAEISARRLSMVTEGRIKQRKLETQMKVEAKLQDIEADWCGGSETMEDIVARIHHREEAAARRERALAYAFSHQWRPNSGQSQEHFIYELGKFNWGWSWMDRWIAACPWEARIPIQSTNPNKAQMKLPNKGTKKTINLSLLKISPVPIKSTASSANGSAKRTSSAVVAKNSKSDVDNLSVNKLEGEEWSRVA